MTRFARAKGSKSSNERLPNDATPWHIMKQELEETLTVEKTVESKTKSTIELTSKKQEPYYCDNLGNINCEWSAFEDKQLGQKTKQTNDGKKCDRGSEKYEHVAATKKKVKKSLPKQMKNNLKNHEITITSNDAATLKKCASNNFNMVIHQNLTSVDTIKCEASKKNKTDGQNDSDPVEINKKSRKRKMTILNNTDNSVATEKCISKHTSKNKMHHKIKAENLDITDTDMVVPTKKMKKIHGTVQDKSKVTNTEILSKRQKRNQKKRNKNINAEQSNKIKCDTENSSEQSSINTQEKLENECNASCNTDGNENQKSPPVFNRNDKQNNKLKRNKISCVDKCSENASHDSNFSKKNNSNWKNHNDTNQTHNKTVPKIRDNKKHKRRKPDPGTVKMTISGKEIEIVKYDGFPVKKEDADRLKELKQNMIIKGIPRSEINIAMKLERRRAEKALAREKKNVCFNCRKSGHNLSDCPELGREENGTGICFKCGSTEHTHFECKVTKVQEFGYATCFICREQGHIARQCPDNPKGLYPDGGACKLCGDVTHLKKDCPDSIRQKEETVVTVDKITTNTLECLDEEVKSRKTESQSDRPKNKIIKF